MTDLRDVLELKHELEAEVRELADRGVCGCGCGGPLTKGGNGRRLYLTGHRQRFRRRLLKRLAEASGVPANLSLKSLQASETTGDRNGDAQPPGKRPRRAPRPGVTLYLPTLEDAERLAGLLDWEGTPTGRRAHKLGQAAYLGGGIAAAPASVRAYVEALEAAYAERLARDELDPAREAIAKALERRRERARRSAA